MSHAIETQDLSYRAGRGFAIENLSLRVPRGSIYGFLGPNGSGKTTTIRLLLGMIRPQGGEIRLLEHVVPRELPQALARIGYVPERPHLYPALTVREALRTHAAFHAARWDAGWAQRLCERFALREQQRVGRLSKGETGKLMMLLALAQRPELLVLDEPTDGLDPMVRRDVIEALLDYVGEAGATVFISSHLVHELERMCDWVGVLDAGRLVTEVPIAQFKNGVKRLRVVPPTTAPAVPFTVLSRAAEDLGPGEIWIVRDWREDAAQYFAAPGGALREVVDLDLEDVFVELLRAARQPKRGSHAA